MFSELENKGKPFKWHRLHSEELLTRIPALVLPQRAMVESLLFVPKMLSNMMSCGKPL